MQIVHVDGRWLVILPTEIRSGADCPHQLISDILCDSPTREDAEAFIETAARDRALARRAGGAA